MYLLHDAVTHNAVYETVASSQDTLHKDYRMLNFILFSILHIRERGLSRCKLWIKHSRAYYYTTFPWLPLPSSSGENNNDNICYLINFLFLKYLDLLIFRVQNYLKGINEGWALIRCDQFGKTSDQDSQISLSWVLSLSLRYLVGWNRGFYIASAGIDF